MSKQEYELLKEQKKFDDLMEVYLKVQKVIRLHRKHPNWFVPNKLDSFEAKADGIWLELQTTIPTTFLVALQETVNERHIMLINQIPSV